jgi:hypothetical protein
MIGTSPFLLPCGTAIGRRFAVGFQFGVQQLQGGIAGLRLTVFGL